MTLLQDFVLETSSNPGVGDFVLNGPPLNRISFAQAFPGGGQVFYYADDGSQAEWGIGTLTAGAPAKIARTEIYGNTLGNTDALRFTGGVEVYNEVPARFVPYFDKDGGFSVSGEITAISLSIRDQALVPDAKDWTGQQAVPAHQADARYLRKYSDSNATAPDQITIYPGSGQLGVYAGGAWHTYQPSGDYATNARVNDVASSATSAASSASANADTRVLRAGDTSQNQTINGYLTIQYGGGKFSFQPDGNAVAYDGSGNSFFNVSPGAINWNGHSFAFLDNLPLDASKKLVCFMVAITSGQRVTFPSGFSAPPDSINFNSTQRLDLWWSDADAGGFTITSNSGVSQTISVIASGNR
ncbi:hypothetical protein [Gluconobacter cerinus]|uniref:hypothetical protein n=1 Tax=Gluconobacter cerinus TaxID=38307 RepID=UPI001B8BA7EE|nr:hypothetical protein [Gluconobacter cerinus]MBS1044483.1 hypothetical protein [Gluconobacter cerinus]